MPVELTQRYKNAYLLTKQNQSQFTALVSLQGTILDAGPFMPLNHRLKWGLGPILQPKILQWLIVAILV